MRTSLIALAVVGCLATLNIMDTFEVLRKVDADEFGRSVIDTLQVHMETGEPVQRFTEIMHSVEEMIERDQKDADKKNRDDQARCDKDIEELQKDNAVLIRRLVEIQATIDDLVPQLQQKNGVLTGKTSWRDELVKQIAIKQEIRNAEIAIYKKKTEEHNYAEFVIKTVRAMFDKPNSFLQEDNKSIANHLFKAAEEASLFQMKTSYGRFFKVMAQIAAGMGTERDEVAVQRIQGLCDILLNNISQSRKLEDRADQVRANNFNAEVGLLNKDLNKLNVQIDSLVAEITQLNDRLTNSKRDQTDTGARQSIKQKQVDDLATTCKQAAYDYGQARAKRDQNRRLVSDIIGIFHANQRDFQAYVKTRTDAGDFEGQTFKVLK